MLYCVLTIITDKWITGTANIIYPRRTYVHHNTEVIITVVKIRMTWCPVPIFSSCPCVAVWPPPVDFTVQTDPDLRAVTSRWNCADKLVHFFSVFNGGQVCVFLSAVGLSFSPIHSLRDKVVLMEKTCGEDDPPWGRQNVFKYEVALINFFQCFSLQLVTFSNYCRVKV